MLRLHPLKEKTRTALRRKTTVNISNTFTRCQHCKRSHKINDK